VQPSAVIAGADHAARVSSVSAPTWASASLLADVADEKPAGDSIVDADDVAVLLPTSGTSGDPKLAVLRHRHLFSYVIGSVEMMGAGEDEATLVSVPPYHIAGLASVLTSLYAGRRMVQLPSFEPSAWVALARDEGVTHALVVPTMLARIVEVLDRGGSGLPDLRHVAYGGGRMPRPVIERAMALLPKADFVNAYGLTETSSTVAVLTPDDHRDALASDDPVVRNRLTSVGRPLPTVEISVRDADGQPVEAGISGEVWVRGEQVAGEYAGRSVTDDAGWFLTKDGGWFDDAGYLYVDGRVDDVIVRGGENLSPGEIEDALLAHPAVRDVAVTAAPDEEWGEVVAAFVVLEDGATADEDDLRAWVTSRLRSSRAPAIIRYRNDLPVTDTGKVLRRVLRAEL
jgi:acyl-CoA synthetase (AMP-forming)/AMP-acid ligase II